MGWATASPPKRCRCRPPNRSGLVLIGAGEALRPLGQLATFIVSAVALVVILFIPSGFLGKLLAPGDRK